MKTIFKLIISITIAISVFVPKITALTGTFTREWLTYLVAGLDEVASNTDSLMLVNINPKGKSASLLQIPRDTYVSLDGQDRKINSLYSYYKSVGNTEEQSMEMLSDFVGDTLGVSVVGYIGITTETLEQFVDNIGGIYVNLPPDIVKLSGLEFLSEGENLLDGKSALRLVRYRQGYRSADIGRMDAQKLFVSGFYHTVTEKVEFKTTLGAFSKVSDKLVTNFGIDDILAIGLKGGFDFSRLEFNYATLPGRATLSDTGTSYYVVSRFSARALLSRLSLLSGDFDVNTVFTRQGEFEKIYYSTDIPYKIYNDKDLLEISIR